MASGTLPLEKFSYYVEQNLLYLPHYARAIAYGVVKAEDDAQLRSFASSLADILNVEMPQNLLLRDRVWKLIGRSAPASADMAPGALSYTSYLVSTAASGTPVEILAVLLPCAWSYGDIGRLLEPAKAEHEVYADWIAFFATDSYAALVAQMREAFDLQAATLSESQRKRLGHIFHTAMRLELSFWNMGYGLESWPGAPTTRAN